MSDPGKWLAWVNDEFRGVLEARVPVYDVGVFLGAAVAEALRTFDLKPFLMDRHMERLYGSMRTMGLKPPMPPEEMEALTLELVERNRPLLSEGEEVSINYFLSGGPLGAWRDLVQPGPTVVVWPQPINFARLGRELREGIGLVVPSTRQLPADCVPPRIKHRSRLHFILADREAHKVDPGSMPVLLDAASNLTETPSANVFLVKDERLATPTTRVCLAGVSRAFVLELAAELGIPAEEKDLQAYDLENADEAFITATSRCVTPVVRVNGRPLGTGKPGPMVVRLLDAWSEHVGLDIRAQMAARVTD